MVIYNGGMPRVKTIPDALVLDRALEVVLQKGPHAVTLRDIGAAAGLSPATLLQRFGSKAGLLDRVFARSTARLSGELAAPPATGDARDALLDLLVRHAAGMGSPDHVAGNLLVLVEDIRRPDRRVAAQAHLRVLRGGIAAHLGALGCAAPEPAALRVEAAWTGLVLQWALEPAPPALEAWLRGHLGPVVDALVAAG